MSVNFGEIIMKYRTGLLQKGQLANFENPDRLRMDQMMALTEKIFSEVEQIDCKMGYPPHDTGLRRPPSVSKDEQHELFIDFLDWYQIVKTPSQDILNHVLQNFPKEKFPKILCVGDGKACHLGRKLAMKGYNVISVDPIARKEFSGIQRGENGQAAGNLQVLQKRFSKSSTDMIEWASVIVGSKIPECVEDLVQIDSKPTVFNISNNPEIYNIKFKGIPIRNKEQFIREITRCSGVEVKQGQRNEKDDEAIYFVRNARKRNLEDKNDGECK